MRHRGRRRIDLDAREVTVARPRARGDVPPRLRPARGRDRRRPVRPDLPGRRRRRRATACRRSTTAPPSRRARDRPAGTGGRRRRRLHRRRDGRGDGPPRARVTRRRPRRRSRWAPSTRTWARWCTRRWRAWASTCAPTSAVERVEADATGGCAAVVTDDGAVRRRPRRARDRRAPRTPTLARDAGLPLGESGGLVTDRQMRVAGTTASGPAATASSRSTGCRQQPGARRRSARTPTSRAGWSAPTSAAATRRSPASSAPRSARCATSRSPGPASRAEADARPGSACVSVDDRVDHAAPATSPAHEPITVKMLGRAAVRAAARRPDRRPRRLRPSGSTPSRSRCGTG